MSRTQNKVPRKSKHSAFAEVGRRLLCFGSNQSQRKQDGIATDSHSAATGQTTGAITGMVLNDQSLLEIGASAVWQNSTFLNVPREIRDMIYLCLYEQCNSFMPAQKSFQVTKDERVAVRVNLIRDIPAHEIHYPKSYPKYSLLPILQTCSQIRTEFLHFLSRTERSIDGKKGPGGLHYELTALSDTKNGTILPTWNTIPLPPERRFPIIEEMKVHYIVWIESEESFSSLANACQSPDLDQYFGPLFRFFSDFFFHGPQGFFDRRLTDRLKPTIRKLVINVRFRADRIDKKLSPRPRDSNQRAILRDQLRVRLHRCATTVLRSGFHTFLETLGDGGYLGGRVEAFFLTASETNEPDRQFDIDWWKKWMPDIDLEREGFSWGPLAWSSRDMPLCTCRRQRQLTKRTTEGHLH